MSYWKKQGAFETWDKGGLSSAARLGPRVCVRTHATTTPQRARFRLRALFDGSADFVAPFRPGTIVIADVIQSQQIGEHEPSVTRAFADPAINYCILFGTRS